MNDNAFASTPEGILNEYATKSEFSSVDDPWPALAGSPDEIERAGIIREVMVSAVKALASALIAEHPGAKGLRRLCEGHMFFLLGHKRAGWWLSISDQLALGSLRDSAAREIAARGGTAAAESLSKKARQQRARKAARARWNSRRAQ